MMLPERLSELLFKGLHESNSIQRWIAKKLFSLLQLLGFHLVADHFYEPIPDTRVIGQTYSNKPRMGPGIDYAYQSAEELLIGLIQTFSTSFFESCSRFGCRERNYYFRGLDLVTLYCFIRDQKPTLVTEVGQGFSTRIIAAALRNNLDEGPKSQLISVDPFNRLGETESSVGGFGSSVHAATHPGDQRARVSRSSRVRPSLRGLQSRLQAGQRLQFLFEEVFPVLRPKPRSISMISSVLCDYPRDWYVQQKRFWNEAHHLENFLRFSSCFNVLLPVNFLARRSSALKMTCDRMLTCDGFEFTGSSFYVRRRS